MFRPYFKLCPEGNCYLVQAGDTLYAISRFYNVSLDDLIDANPNVDPELITQGQVICIPPVAPSVNCPMGAATYVVQEGDSFYSIAKRNKMRLSSLLKANPNVNPDALLIGQSICIPVISSTYTNDTYKVMLIYPYRWSKIDNARYAGIDGFFHISAISSDATLDEVCSSEAHHKLKPYGTQPTLSSTTIDGQEACFIIPSTDQPMEMRGQSALVVKYAKPIEIESTTYQFLIIWVDKNHLRDIAGTLEFLDE
ncbi:MAG: LysM peptidoglycan-binding domain-containing protein [Clostridia bacterium]